MTIEEKREELKKYCNTQPTCDRCILLGRINCYIRATDEQIEKNYDDVFSSKNCSDCKHFDKYRHDEPCIHCCNNYADNDKQHAIWPCKFEPKGTEEATKAEHDSINHPAHYEQGGFECIDVMIATQGVEAVKAYCICCAFKYLWRHRLKGGSESIAKARWYLDKYLELEGNSDD